MLGRRRWTVVPVLAVLATVLAACSEVSEDEVSRLRELPGVSDARRSCSLTCLLSVEVERDIEVDQLARVLRAVRIIDAKDSDIDVDLGETGSAGSRRTSVGVRATSRASDRGDTAIARLVTEAVDDGSVGLEVVRSSDATTVQLRAGEDASTMFAAAAVWWPRASRLPSARLVAQTVPRDAGGSSGEGPSRLVATRSFPTRQVEAARALARTDAPRPTGFLVDGSRLRVGASSVEAADALERAVAALPARRREGVEVVVADNVLATDREGAAVDATRRGMVRAAEQVEGVTGSVDTGTVVLRSDDARAARTAAERARRAAGGADVPVTVRLGVDTEVELRTDGPPDLVTLAGLFVDRAEQVTVKGPNRGTGPADGDGPDGYLTMTVRTDDGLPATVTQVARRMKGLDVDLSLVLGITAEDPEGRSPQARLRVERQGGRWVVVDDPDDRRADPDPAIRRAWAAGS